MSRHSDIVSLLAEAFRDAQPNYGYNAYQLATAVLAIADDLMTPQDVADYLGKPRTSVQALYRRPNAAAALHMDLNVGGRQPLFYRGTAIEWTRLHRDLVPSNAPVLKDLKLKRWKQT